MEVGARLEPREERLCQLGDGDFRAARGIVDQHANVVVGHAAPTTASSAVSTASPAAVVPAEPPRSRVSAEPSAMEVSTAASIQPPARAIASSSSRRPSHASISDTDRIVASGFAEPCPGDVRRRSVRRLEEAVPVADVARRGEAEAADRGGAEVGEDVAEHVLRDDHVEVRGPLHEVERGRVDVRCLELDVGVCGRHVRDDLAEERVRGEYVRLVHAGHPRDAVGRCAGPPLRELERALRDARRAGARDDPGVGDDLAVDAAAAGATGVQALGVLTHDHVVDTCVGVP